MKKIICFYLSSFLLGACTSMKVDWSKYSTPAGENPQAHGSYAAGCLEAAAELPLESPHYQVMNSSRRRYYGHPQLIDFIKMMSEAVYRKKLGVSLIGDLSQVRGGPMLSGHNSHQVGLDVDVWFRRLSENERKSLTPEQVQNLELVYLAENDVLTKNWNEDYLEVLKWVAEQGGVERIFINPAIKAEICRTRGGQAWLRKLRPWWGHDEHFHVRLACPTGSTTCEPQVPPEEGDGCGQDLAWWFSEEAKSEAAKRGSGSRRYPKLPQACGELAEKPESRTLTTKN